MSELGSGGMGAVYRAHDERLGRDVALKQLLPEIAADSHARGRFLREARAVARLNHPNIVQIFDVMEADGRDWIVLELAEGRTLAESMAGGKLSLAQALSLASELAKGLAAAHAEGIVHRDLKAKNVIVNDQGQVKILDFGLAKQLKFREDDASLSATGGLMGTPQAMSPEQVLGKTVDYRSDLFSLGSLLYEMLTGISPFLDSTPVETMKKVYDHRQVAASELESEIPREVSDLTDKLLEKDPDARPQSAQQVSLVLDELLIPLEGSTASVSVWPSPSREVLRPWLTRALGFLGLVPLRWLVPSVILVVVAVAFAWFRWSESGLVESSRVTDSTTRPLEERPRIVVGSFDNRTGEVALGEALSLAFRIGLEQSRHALVLPDSQIREVLGRMNREARTAIIDRDTGIEICKREGAKALVTGSIIRIGRSYQLSANIIDPWTGINTFSSGAIAKDQDRIVSALDSVTREVRNHLGESLAAIEATVQLEKVTTRDLEALKAYSAGESKRNIQAYREARRLFLLAIEKDPEFAMAHAKMATIDIEERHSYSEALIHLDRALELSDRLTDFEELYVKGWLARLRGTPQEIVDVWSSMSSLHPNQVAGYQNAGMAQFFLFNRFDKALVNFRNALKLETDPRKREGLLLNLGYCQLAIGQSEDALQSFQKLSAPAGPVALYHLTVGDYERARALLDEPHLVSDLSDRLRHLELWMILHARRGDFEGLETDVTAMRRIAGELGDDSTYLAGFVVSAALFERLGRESELGEILIDGFEVAEDLLQAELEMEPHQGTTLAGIHKLPVHLLAFLGKLGARNSRVGEVESQQREIERLAEQRSLPLWIALSKMLEAEILAARGQHRAAIARLHEAQAAADSFQIHESLARFHQAVGDVPRALAKYEWIITNPGRAIAECFGGCQAANIFDHTIAFYRLARLHDENGERQEAVRYYRQFVDRWPRAEDLPEWRSARRRLSELGADFLPEKTSGQDASRKVQ